MNFPTGKGIWIWAIRDCQPKGDPQDIADRLALAGIRHVTVKIANGTNVPGVNYQTISQTRMLCARLQERNITVWGWQYVLGENPTAEAKTAADIVKAWGLDGFAADMEGEFDTKASEYSAAVVAAKAARAYTYSLALRSYLPDVPLGLASYRYPITSQPYFPWQIRRFFDADTPQVYWEGSTNPGAQVRKSYEEFRRLSPPKPFYPIGSAYKRGSWTATPAQIDEFLNACRELGLEGASFWELGRMDLYAPSLYPAIVAYPWKVIEPEPPDPCPEPPPPPPQEITVSTTRSEYFPFDLVLRDGTILTGRNVNGQLINVPGIPSTAKVIKARIVAVSNSNKSWVALGTGNSGLSRFKLVGRPVVTSSISEDPLNPISEDPYDDGNNGPILLPSSNKVYLQWFVPSGKKLKCWIYLQGYEW